ncbi:SDR family NAD(P)-dependent oxidoreductase [Gemmobacter sp.]|uniref:SDR family NAD(P)-dependent oxidoreductase n=1 Tax=Gemmobacter sp. TaxID=1898957 RepID=UPI002AFE2752|nr:SDR family oxidoreductase [Gemmobacter sp.]
MVVQVFDDPQAQGAVVVAGGSGGLGREIARAFAEQGLAVGIGYRGNAAGAEALVQDLAGAGHRAMAGRMDLLAGDTVAAFLDSVADRFGGIGTVVYAAGPKVSIKPIAEFTPQEWADALTQDATGFFTLCHHAIPHLRRSRGSIVALSTAGTRRYPPLDVLSAGPKASVEMLVRGIAREEGRNGIRANAIGVGQIEAGQGAELLADPRFQRLAQRVLEGTPLRRWGTAADVANVALFLASPLAAFVTGQTICADGGGHV